MPYKTPAYGSALHKGCLIFHTTTCKLHNHDLAIKSIVDKDAKVRDEEMQSFLVCHHVCGCADVPALFFMYAKQSLGVCSLPLLQPKSHGIPKFGRSHEGL